MKKLKNVFKSFALATSKGVMVAAIAVLAVFTLISALNNDKILFGIGLILTVAYSVVCVMIIRKESASSGTGSQGLLSGMTLDFVMNVSSPVVIVEDGGAIIWHNKAASAIIDVKPNAYGKNVCDIISPELTDDAIAALRSETDMLIEIGGRTYEVNAHKMGNLGAGHSILIFEDKSELIEAERELKMSSVVVAYVVIDNFTEAMQFVQDKYRTALAMIGGTLDKWCVSIGGIMRESEKDKYLFIFEERHLETIVKSKFDILDSIRNINIEGIDIPFTASIGVSNIKGSYSEKEKAASQALDLALQRGGDQAVLKTEKGMEIFGGRFKSVQKRTKIRSRIIASELMRILRADGNVIIQGHRFADHDCIASCIGVAKMAMIAGKKPKIVVNINDANLKPIFAMMRGNEVYSDMFIDALEAQDMVRSNTINIICDVNNPVQFEARDVFENAAVNVIIDHHRKTGEYSITPKISYIEPSASSASELVCEMLEQICEPGALSQIEADLLFAGLILDTKQFSKNTGVRTFGAALYLRGEGAEPMTAGELFKTDIAEFKRQSEFEKNAEYYGKEIIISKYYGESNFSDKILLAKAADRLLSIERTRATFTMCAIENDVHISARSNGTLNVQLILEALGGGGHYDSAGAQLKGVSVDEGYEMLCKAIDGYMKNDVVTVK